MKNNIAIIGLGKLGLCTALSFAKAKFNVAGYDISKEVLNRIKKKKLNNFEPGVNEYLFKYKKNYSFSNDLNKIHNSYFIFIIVPTPSKENFEFSNKFILAFIQKFIKNRVKNNISSKFHLIISSTVMPGSCSEFIKIIEKSLKIKINKDFYFSYNPEFIALGTVIHDFENPDMVLIGSSCLQASNELKKIYKKSVKTRNFETMSIISAEITKIALNSYITLKISFANTIMRICDNVKNSNPYHICKAIGQDKRVSPHYFRPGLPFSGPCFPRDNQAFNFFQKKIKIKNFITSASINSNLKQIEYLNKKIYNHIKVNKFKNILLLGLSFKNNTSVVEKSYSLELIKFLINKKINLRIYEKNLNTHEPQVIFLKKLLVKKITSEKYDLIINTNSTKINLSKKLNYLDLWNFKY
jgi:UDPglucose 6-dehydrogenase